MSSTFSTLKIELIATGEQSGTWGASTNNNLGSAVAGSRGLEQAIVGMATLETGDFTSNIYTMPYVDDSSAQDFRAFVLNITATLSAAGTVNVPAIQKPYLVFNNSVGGYAVTIKVSGQTGITIPSGKKAFVYNNGTDVGETINFLSSLQLGGNLQMPTASAILDANNNELIKFPSAVASAVNEVTVTNAATGSGPAVQATGNDSNIDLNFTPKGSGNTVLTSGNLRVPSGASIVDTNSNELIKFPSTVSSAVNEITVTNAATGNSPTISATGGDTNIGLSFAAKGTGTFNFTGTANTAASLRLYEDTDTGTNYVGIKAPSAITADVTWTLPDADGTIGQALVTNGSGTLSWTTITSGATISNDTSTASNLYPAFLGATSGTALNIYTSNAKLLYKPSTGDFQASQLVAGNGLILNSTTIAESYTIGAGTNAMSVGPITVASGQSVTVSSGQKWVVL